MSEAMQAALEEMRAILIGYAQRRQTITYSELAPMISSLSLHHRAPVFHKMLDLIDEPGSPSLAAIVVRKDTGIPGQGYYVNSGADVGTEAEQRAYWQRRFDEVCDYWAGA